MADSFPVFQKGFNYSQDGPGNRLVYHLWGCNLSCPWCANPEGLYKNNSLIFLTEEDIVAEALSCRMMFFEGGGVTFTGGEVTLNCDRILHLIRALKLNSIHTCIETNASVDGCEELFKEVDYMIADYKSPSKEKLKEVTGADLDIIEKNLILRARTGKPLLVRIPLINGFNTSENDAVLFCEFFKKLSKARKDNVFFEILTYHEFGKDKYEKLSVTYTVSDGFVHTEDKQRLANEILKNKLKLINT